MIERQSNQEAHVSPLRHIVAKALLVLSTILLAGIAIGLACFMGKRITSDEWPILVTATGLATFVVISIINARHALLLWMVMAPFARFIYLDIELGRGIPNLTLSRIMTGVLLLLILAQAATGRRKLVRLSWADFLLLLFCLAAAVSVPSTVTPLKSAAQTFFDRVVIPIAVYFLARNLITNRRDLTAVMYTLVIIGLYLALLATREQLTGDVLFYPEDRSIQYTASIRRVVGLLGNPAFTVLTINMTVPWTWYLLSNARRHRLALLVILGIMMAGAYFCMNRSGWVGLLVALITMALLIKRFRQFFVVMLLVGAIVAGVYWALIVSSPAVQERLRAQGPIEYRAETWRVALIMLRDNPILGVGYENFSQLYQHYGRWDINAPVLPTPHNTYLWVLLAGGVVAFVPFIAFLGVVVFSALRLWAVARGSSDGFPDAGLAGVFLASMASILTSALALDVIYGTFNTMIMFLIMGAFWGAVSGESQRIRPHLGGNRKAAQAALF